MKTNALLVKENMDLISKNEDLENRVKELERLNKKYSAISRDAQTEADKKVNDACRERDYARKNSAENGHKVDCLRSFLYRSMQLERNVRVTWVRGGLIRIETSPKISYVSVSAGESFLKTETIECMDF